MPRRLLLTGPTNGAEAYAEAARVAGWEVLDRPLVEVRCRDLDEDRIHGAPPHWVLVTSSNALPALSGARGALAETPFACVGARTAARLSQLGFRVALEPARDAADLARRMREAVPPKVRGATRVLWPRGSLSAELGEELESAGFAVDAPLAYETVPREDPGPLSGADAVFFASPSAVRRYVELVRFVDRHRPLGIAIGATTLRALERSASHHFRAFAALDHPNATELGALLAQIGAE